MLYSGSEYLALPRDPQPWLVEGLIPSGGLVNFYGKPKTGKSWGALGLAIAISNAEQHWNGFKIHNPGPVAYIQIDTPRSSWAKRINELIKAGHKLNNLYMTDRSAPDFPYPFNIQLPNHYEWLKLNCAQVNFKLIIIDTLRECFSGNENDSDVMKSVINNIVDATNPAAVMLISHRRKGGLQNEFGGQIDDLMDDMRGSGYLAGRADVIMKLTDHELHYQGRDVEKDNLAIRRDGIGLVVAKDMNERLIQLAIKQAVVEGERLNYSILRMGERACKLSGDTITVDAARKRIERMMGKKTKADN